MALGVAAGLLLQARASRFSNQRIPTHERPLEDRMDRRDVESRDWLHEGEPRVQALLRTHVCRAFSRRARSSVRVRLRPSVVAKPAPASSGVEATQAYFRQLDERPLPREGA